VAVYQTLEEMRDRLRAINRILLSQTAAVSALIAERERMFANASSPSAIVTAMNAKLGEIEDVVDALKADIDAIFWSFPPEVRAGCAITNTQIAWFDVITPSLATIVAEDARGVASGAAEFTTVFAIGDDLFIERAEDKETNGLYDVGGVTVNTITFSSALGGSNNAKDQQMRIRLHNR